MARGKVHRDRRRERARAQASSGMSPAMGDTNNKSGAARAESRRRRAEGGVGGDAETTWSLKRRRAARYERLSTPGILVTTSEEIANEWSRQDKWIRTPGILVTNAEEIAKGSGVDKTSGLDRLASSLPMLRRSQKKRSGVDRTNRELIW